MEDNTRVFHSFYEEQPPEAEEMDFQDGYAQDDGAYDNAEEYGDGYYYEDGYGGENGYTLAEDDTGYDEAAGSEHRFRVALNVMDTASVLAGVVVILILTTLIISLVSWLRMDILHSFVLLQANVQ